MATPKKRIKIRDRDKTLRKLIDVVGDIIREKGHTGLNEVQIANRSGNARSLIRYYFNGLANLKKAYIKEKDYWAAIFQDFQLLEDPDEGAIRQLFTELMQENFRYFRNDPEMQKIILWQISEESQLLTGISEAREAEGDKLFEKTDKYFRDSGIDFRSVIGLLLGGIYYIVLHSQTNKSKVAGVDINMAKDRRKVLITIKQIIEWAWEKAEVNTITNHLNQNMINNETDAIEAIAIEIAGKSNKEPIGKIPDTALVMECKRLKKVFEKHLLSLKSPTQAGNFQNIIIQKLVSVCDRLYKINDQANPNTTVILDLISGIRNIIPQKINPQLALPRAFVDEQSPVLKTRWENLLDELTARNIDGLLIEITGLPVTLFNMAERKLTWGDYTWLKRYFTLLEDMDWINPNCSSTSEALISQLIRMDFNHQRFFAYCYRLVRQKVDAKVGKKQKLQELLRCKTLILQDSPIAEQRFEHRVERISVQLCNWVDAESAFVSATEADDPTEGFYNPFKLSHKTNILETAVWYKMLYDIGFFGEANLDIFAEKLIHNCSTKQQADISLKSMSTKFFAKDEKVIRDLGKNC